MAHVQHLLRPFDKTGFVVVPLIVYSIGGVQEMFSCNYMFRGWLIWFLNVDCL